ELCQSDGSTIYGKSWDLLLNPGRRIKFTADNEGGIGAVVGREPCLELWNLAEVPPNFAQRHVLDPRIEYCDIRNRKVSAVPDDVDDSIVLAPLVPWKLGHKRIEHLSDRPPEELENT